MDSLILMSLDEWNSMPNCLKRELFEKLGVLIRKKIFSTTQNENELPIDVLMKAFEEYAPFIDMITSVEATRYFDPRSVLGKIINPFTHNGNFEDYYARLMLSSYKDLFTDEHGFFIDDSSKFYKKAAEFYNKRHNLGYSYDIFMGRTRIMKIHDKLQKIPERGIDRKIQKYCNDFFVKFLVFSNVRNEGLKILQTSLIRGDINIANMLLEQGDNINDNVTLCKIVDTQTYIELDIGTLSVLIDKQAPAYIIKYAISKGCDINSTNDKGFNDAMVLSIRGNNLDMVKLLIEHGADKVYADKYHTTKLIDLAERQSDINKDIIDYIKQININGDCNNV